MCLTFASEKCNLNSGSRKMVGLELCSVGLEHGCGFLFSREMGWDEVFPSQPSATHSSKLAKLLPRHLHVIMWHLFDRVWWRVFHPLLNTCAVHLSVCARARARARTRTHTCIQEHYLVRLFLNNLEKTIVCQIKRTHIWFDQLRSLTTKPCFLSSPYTTTQDVTCRVILPYWASRPRDRIGDLETQ